jgi:hypothetical protein
MTAYFETIPHDDGCAYCTGVRQTSIPAPIEAIYCISLKEQPHRTRKAAAHFHDIGLCRFVTLYCPHRGNYADRAIWESHQAVARHALGSGQRCILILEDDVYFRQSWPKLSSRIRRAMAALPPDWQGFYLGHVPFQAYFFRPNILRTRSACAHAYVANTELLSWLADTKAMDAEVGSWRFIGHTIDGALANRPKMYALFPMAALQRFLGDYRIDSQRDPSGSPRTWYDHDRWRYHFIFRGALVMQALAVLLAPFFSLTLERFRKRSETGAVLEVRLIRASRLFDENYYLRLRPDVADLKIDPLAHYLRCGAAEGAWPNPLFDLSYYAGSKRDSPGENPLLHYIKVGSLLRLRTHVLFDPAYYIERYAAEIGPDRDPLEHFLSVGGTSGFDPHPLFDSRWYLSQNPKVRESGTNPLVHYLLEGWHNGASPHPQFDGDLYLQQNPDVKAAGVNPLDHFVRHGQAEGRAQPFSGRA